MIVTSKTKISAILKANPEAVETIAQINSNFNKLRNPILRKILAGRVTVESAAKVGGVTTAHFLQQLESIGFTVEISTETIQEETTSSIVEPNPTKSDSITDLDVRPILDGGEDPFKHIMTELEALPAGGTLRVINHFKPTPLIGILENKGYTAIIENPEENVFYTYLKRKTTNVAPEVLSEKPTDFNNFDTVSQLFEGKKVEIDVRQLDMPEPMVNILAALNKLPEEHCLFVHHKKMPQFLIPELKERNFVYVTKEIEQGEVKIIILRNPAK